MKNQLDPRRFIGKSFTRRQTFATSEHDYEAARVAYKAKFWEWHVWAMKKEAMAAWEGAEA